MLIDWFTVAAQAVNFLILVWLLKRFLYGPIMQAVEEREKMVKSKIREAESQKEEADKEQEKYRQKKEDFEKKRQSMLEEASEKADEKRKELLQEARQQAEELRKKLERSIREKREDLTREIRERTQREVFAITRNVLRDLASASLEEHMARLFVRRLREMEDEKKDRLVEALDASSGAVTVKSAFELPEEQKNEIEKAVEEIATADIRCRFEQAPEKISGIELTTGGYKTAWSVADYVSSLEKKLAELLDEEEAASASPQKSEQNAG